MRSLDKTELLARNPHVNVERVRRYAAYVEHLEKRGLNRRRGYQLGPALGDLAAFGRSSDLIATTTTTKR